MAMESPSAINEDFNISTGLSTTVLQLAELIWRKINPGEEFSYVCDPPYPHDVQMRVPDVRKARGVLGFKAQVGLDVVLDEVIRWIAEQMKVGRM
jgi:UDP-glucose 4-epimerase